MTARLSVLLTDRKEIVIICFLYWFALSVNAQNSSIDSLQRLIDNESDSKRKVELLNQLSFNLFGIDNERAGASTQLAVQTAVKIGDQSGEGWALAYQGLYFLFRGSLNLARENFKKSLKISQNLPDQNLEVYSLNQIGNVFRDRGIYDSSYYFYRQAEGVNHGKLDRYYLSVVKINKGRYFLVMNNPDSALLEIKRGIAIRESLKMTRHLPDPWILLGNCYLQRFNYMEAQYYYDKAMKAAPKSPIIRFQYLIKMGEVHFRQGNFPQAIENWTRALAEQKKLNYQYETAQLLFLMGEVFEEQGYFELAVEYLTESLRISEKANYMNLIGEGYYLMAWVFYRAKDQPLAIQNLQKAETLFHQTKRDLKLAGCLNLRGLIQMRKKNYDSAFYFHQQSLLQRIRIGDLPSISSSLFNLGELYNNRNEHVSALPYLWKGVKMDEQINDNYGKSLYYYELGRTYNLMGGLDSTRYYLDKSIELSIPNSSNDILHKSYQEMADFLQKKGKLKEAIFYYKKHLQLNDTLYSKQSSQMMASYKTLYDVETKEKEIELLSKDKLLAEAKAQEQQMIFYWVMAGLAILIALFIFYFLFSQRLKRLNAVILERGEKIQAQSGELTNQNSLLSNLNQELVESNQLLKGTLNDLHQTQAQLVQSEKMASLGILSAGVAHELNNPLNFIKGGVNALDNELKSIEESRKKEITPYIDIINEGVNRASVILKGLSQYSRQSDQQNELCDIHKILNNCLLMLSNNLKHRITVEKYYSKEPFTLTGNEGKLHQAFINLLSNAEQAIDGNGVIRITTQIDNGTKSISIEDTGKGISKENLARIGDPFFTTKAPGQGTGLGLSITYQIIGSHGGKVFVTSELNRGTKFLLLFN